MEEKSQVTIGLATKPSVRPSQPTDSKENLFEKKEITSKEWEDFINDNDISFKKIILTCCNLEEQKCKRLSEKLKQNKNIESLSLINNEIGSEGLKHLCEALKQNNTLKELNISDNKIGNEGCKFLLEFLKENNSLLTLDINKNNITAEGCKLISEGLKWNIWLKDLFFNENDIGDIGCSYLIDALNDNASLQKIRLRVYNIEESKSRLMNEKFESNKENLLFFKNNPSINWDLINEKPNTKRLVLADCSVNEIKLDFSQFKSLVVLDLRNNELNNQSVLAICEFIKWHPTLKTVNLQENKTIGDNEATAILNALSFNFVLIQCNLAGTSVSNELQEKIKNKLKENYPLTQSIGKTALNKICSKYPAVSTLIVLDKISEVKQILNKEINQTLFLQEVLFICCVWNKLELCEYILNLNININYKLEDGNTYIHFSVMRDNYEISILLLEKEIDITLLNKEEKTCSDLLISPDAKCKGLFGEIKQLKVVILGQERAGKTTLVKKILKIEEGFFAQMFQKIEDTRTDGIEMHKWDTGLDKNNNIQLWDFGGQELFHTAHQFFLSKNSVHLLLFDLTVDNEQQLENNLLFWLNSIQYRAPGSKVMIIGTHLDKCKLKTEDIQKISAKIQELYEKVIKNVSPKNNTIIISNKNDSSKKDTIGSKKNNNKIEIIPCSYWENPKLGESHKDKKLLFYPINGKDGWNIKYVEEQIRKLSFGTVVSREFLELTKTIISLRNSESPPLKLREELKSLILKELNNNQDKVRKNLKLLHELGYILDFGHNYKYVIIDPKWLSTIFRSVISLNVTNQIKNGEIQVNSIINNLDNLLKSDKSNTRQSFNPSSVLNSLSSNRRENEKFHSQNEFLLQLLQDFNIIIPHPNDSLKLETLKHSNEKNKYSKCPITMIIPSLMDSNKPKRIEETNSFKIEEILGRTYEFSFVPKGIYENLFNKVSKPFQGDAIKFWKNGFRITSASTFLILEITENSKITIRTYGDAQTKAHCKYLASFHFIIQDLFKSDYSLLWDSVCIEVYYKGFTKSSNAPFELTKNYKETLEAYSSGTPHFFVENMYAVELQKLIPEKIQGSTKDEDIKVLDSSKIIELRNVGSGTYGEIFTCSYLENGGRYIMKKFRVDLPKGLDIEKLQKAFQRELEIMKKLKHPNLTRLIGYIDATEDKRLFIDLFDYSLKKLQETWLNKLPPKLQTDTQRDPLDDRIRNKEEYWWKEEEMIFISLQISNGLEYLHNEKFISHLDLKADNILVNLKENFEDKRPSLLSIHIADFGTSHKLNNNNLDTISEYVGSLQHMAPEVKKNNNSNNILYNPFKADIYSLGVVFCEIVGNETSLKANLDKLKGKTKLEGIIRNCLQEEPAKRNNISKIKESLQDLK